MDHIDRAGRISRKTVSIISKSMLVAAVITLAFVQFPSISAAPSCGGLSATVVGTANSDVLRGTEGNDVIVGRAGDDIIYGSGGNDIICGNGGNDTIYGGSGNDIVYGGYGKDLIYGNESDDSLFGQGGIDTIDGGGGVNSCESGESVVNCGSNAIPTITTPPADTTPPSVTITSPLVGTIMSGTTTISVVASDDVGVTKLEFYIDGVLIGSHGSSSYTLPWDTNTLQNGPHDVSAKAYDAAGNVGDSVINVSVNNSISDTIAPIVSWLSPTDGSTVSGIIHLRIDARDNIEVWYVQIRVDGGFFDFAKNPWANEIYMTGIDTTMLTNGIHKLQALVVDSDGNTSVADIFVFVSN